jgi:hypothetical protein
MTNNSIKEKRQTNTKWGNSKDLSIIQKKICNMFQENKRENGPMLSTHNFHSSREKKTKWAYMEPIRLYLKICKHILRSSLRKNESKSKKMVLHITYNCFATNHKIEAYPKGTHCILMLTLQICSASINHSPNYFLQDFFKLKKMP